MKELVFLLLCVISKFHLDVHKYLKRHDTIFISVLRPLIVYAFESPVMMLQVTERRVYKSE